MEGRPGAAGRFARELNALYVAARRPKLSSLVSWGRQQQPPLKLSVQTLSDWFNPAILVVPADARALRMLIAHLQNMAKERSEYQPRDPPWWKRLQDEAWAERNANRGGRPAKSPPRGSVVRPAASPVPVPAEVSRGREPAQSYATGVLTNLPRRNWVFTGRTALLDLVGAELADGPVAVVAVRGLGGIGKSQVALEYAHRCGRAGTYEITWWVRAETALTVAEDLAALAPSLGLQAGADQEKTVGAVRAVLQRRSGWLLVFDNAPSPHAVRDLLPDGDGHVLITSRTRGWGELARQIDVEEFGRDESLAYLATRLGRFDPDADALAVTLGDLPLALAQAAAYLDVYGGLSIATYLEIYRVREEAGRLLARRAGDDYPDSVATTWLIHLAELAATEPASLELLRLCAQLDSDDINLGLLLSRPTLLGGPLTGRLAIATRTTRAREEAIGALARTSLITRLDDHRVRIHRLVADITRRHLTSPDDSADRRETGSQGAEAEWTGHTVNLIGHLFPVEPWEPAAWPTCAQLAAHGSTVVDHAIAIGAADGTAGAVLTRLGQYLDSRAESAQARATLNQALAIKEAVYGSGHPEVATTLGSLGIVQQHLGELADARTKLRRALAIFEAAYGPDHPEVATTLSFLGEVQTELGDLAAARASQERALAINEVVYGSDHPEVATTLRSLGIIQQQLGELVPARISHQRALSILEATYGPDALDVATTLGNLGMVELQLGELADARTKLRRTLAIVEAAYGPDHPQVAVTLTGLGSIQQEMGELVAARISQERAIAIFEATYGPDHPRVAATLTNLGVVQEQLGDSTAARLSHERALAIFEATYGSDNPQIAITLANLGNVQRQLRELVAARTSQERALAIFEAAYGPDHSQVAATLTNLGVVQQELGDSVAARTSLERAGALHEAVHGTSHPRTVFTRSLLDELSRTTMDGA